jgi:hypothetical protein
LQFGFRPEYNVTVSYALGAKVKDTQTNGRAKHYQSVITSNLGNCVGNPSYWTQIDMAGEFGNTIQYSAWTDDKAGLWKNAGGDPDNNNGGAVYVGP